MTHQEGIARAITAVLSLDSETIAAFIRGNPFDKLLRSYDEFTADGRPLYRKELGTKHYKMSVQAVRSGLSGKELYGEHRIPLTIIAQRLLQSDRSLGAVRAILESNEVVLITADEQKRLDSAVSKGGLGLRSRLPPGDGDRLHFAQIEIAPESVGNSL